MTDHIHIAKTCANCTRPFDTPSWAANKRFCSDSCRQSWHSDRRKQAMELLRHQQALENKERESSR